MWNRCKQIALLVRCKFSVTIENLHCPIIELKKIGQYPWRGSLVIVLRILVCVVYKIGPIILCGSEPRETTLFFSFNESEHCQSVRGAGIKVKYILMYTLKPKNLEYCFYTEKLKKKKKFFYALFCFILRLKVVFSLSWNFVLVEILLHLFDSMGEFKNR